ncbi:hypothetical protein [Streptomyces bullii]|uniref:Uncharacterized protein n=1 Tax=Streptomyces bullii TaxID=349910 RepID=A0ABW0UKU0_9ACTN
MTDLSARRGGAASSDKQERVAELHRLAREDYASTARLRNQSTCEPLYGSAALTVREHLRQPPAVTTAVRVAQQMLAIYGTVDSRDIYAYAQAHGGLSEALRILLRALGAEPNAQARPAPVETTAPAPRCPAAHPEDPTQCVGPVVVTVLDADNAGADGCEHHGARLLASLEGGRVYALPDAPAGAAIRVFKAADTTRPFAWVDGPRSRPEHLSYAENRRGGEGQ